MDHNLTILSKIGEHLVYLTTHDSFGSSRSKGIETFEQLSQELNAEEICPKKGYWTSHSLECFFSRCRSRYDKPTLRTCFDLTMVGVSEWEYLGGSTKQSMGRKRSALRAGTTAFNGRTSRYQCIQGERWKEHEEGELFQEAAKLKNIAKNSKIFSNSESFSQKAA